jgi:hypothetical protein
MSSSGSVLPVKVDQDYGSAFVTTSQRKFPLQLADLIVEPVLIRRYVEYLTNKYNTIHLSAEEFETIVPQPSPVGLTVIAHYYNNKGDQHLPILIGTSVDDFKKIVQRVADSSEDTKLLIIMQFADNIALEHMMYRSHKVTIYLEKREHKIHIAFAEVIPVASMTQLYRDLANSVLENKPRNYYLIDPIKIKDKNTDVFVQSDYWSCGTLSFRIARVISKTKDFLASIKEVESVEENNITTVKYVFPIAFAKCADTSIPRKHCELFYRPNSDLLVTHYAKYSQDFSYTAHFTNKYLHLIQSVFKTTSPDELNAIIDSADIRYHSFKHCDTPRPR